MKRVLFTTLLVSCLISPLVFSVQISSSQSKANQLVDLIKDDTSLSSANKITAYEALLNKEKIKEDLNDIATLVFNEALLVEMLKVGSYVEITTLFKTFIPLENVNKTNENINIYVRLLRSAINAYLMLQKYDNAKKLIAELQPYFSLYDVTDVNKAHVFMGAGQLNVRTGKYKDGVSMLLLAMQTFGKSSSLSEENKRKKISTTLSYVGHTYFTLGDYKNAIKYYEKSIDKAGDLLEPLDITIYNHNIALSQLELFEWEQALNTATLASQQAKDVGSDVFVAFANEIISRAKHGLGKSTEAIKIIDGSIGTYKKINDTQRIIEALAYEAEFHISLGNWDEAKKNTIEAYSILAIAKSQAKPTIELFKSSFLIEEKNNNFDKALLYQKQLTKLKEEDFEAKKMQDAQRLMLNFELELAEEKSLRLEQENKLKSIIIERNQSKHRFLMTVISGAIVMLVLLVYVYMRERNLKLKMSHLAMTDFLTGCPNRRNAMHQAKVMLSNQVNKKHSMTIAILDVDNFKAVNDTYGHDVGDKVLQNLSSIMLGALRETDVMGRYGGEEFIILLPNAGEKEVTIIFYRMQQALKNHICEYKGESIVLPITISMGASVVSYVPEQLDENEQKLLLDTIIKKADNKAYEAKEEGKDQLRFVAVSIDS
ncbi:tetratricopeptide repeat-containing diguanylate cyclase [Brumicola pallidula]|nr:tetratricopeptide repeat-containing diguanylate cyclase [Glaciecola pallidula]